ncbi:putative Bardet-Biedl syndrome 1 protein-like (BBS1-like protein 1) [Leptomonas pyrrhocoris]|uniref:Putative Bardet-Biedl syndrome 1 protein-like (BBS1-like protein 1) n=1 Tax=Leptomonas pyrrhocoris TaxID=157538 RepID=A0A0M9GAT6_LEPPY|nr:putative Bardet-Biedl syndrome 1 protein-like (BBS1-like protein 1) [Leptomonas pyrrhocoris]KPA86510.1 putative Bardet-Biedl syndrome 1 protein-like (BBS1-like protein 1) [Leptomonas pyrrhocoris]|eukprot:XP_015664949.1 putative Bardet-Biedl syndrome 1 protein-like (BBS1-like protein 1) [Leptomonas pyrrhocoris]
MSHKERSKGASSEKFWLYAFRDHLANLRAFSNCIETADVSGNGDYQLLVADGSKKLKVFGGTTLQRELPLFGVPSAVASFYMDVGDAFSKPVVAVATGPYIFMYRNNKPLYRYMVPAVPIDAQESSIWNSLAEGVLTVDDGVAKLEALLDSGVQTSSRTLELLLLDTAEERSDFVMRMRAVPLIQMDVVTCMASIPCSATEAEGRSCLVIGTEAGFLYVLSERALQVRLKVVLPSPPVFLIVAGCLEVNYRIIAACRDGRVYSTKQDHLHSAVIQPDAQPCAIARFDNLIAVATTANTLTYYNLKGKKQQSLFLPCSITNLATITDPITAESKALVVALSNGEIRVLVGTQLLHVSLVYGTVTAMKFCRYGRANGALVLVLQNGSLVVELLHRNADLTSRKAVEIGPPPEQDVPIPVPFLSSVFTAQTSREQKYGADMYQLFQCDLSQLRLTTAKAYLEMINNGAVPTELGNVTEAKEEVAESSLRMNAVVQGLGPVFKVKVQLQNVGESPIHAVRVVFCLSGDEMYRMAQQICTVPTLLPSVPLSCEALVQLVEGEVKGNAILVVASDPKSASPLASTLVDLPEAELIEGL